jgi:MFS family permease
MAVPATLGLLADATDGDRMRRGRQMSLFELVSAGGIAVGAALGPLLWAATGLWAFTVVAGTYVLGGLIVVVFVREPRRADGPGWRTARRWLAVLADRRLLAFLPAWVAVNAIMGTWVASQVTFVLAGDRRVPGQRFTGALAGHGVWLPAVLGGYVLLFVACVVVWAFLVGRLPTRPTLLVTLAGAVVASAGLIAANHGASWWLAGPVVLVGVFLEAGFTPAALTYLADVSGLFAGDRGLVLGGYSVVLGVGYLVGNVAGGAFAQWLAFDGLAVLTILLAVVGLCSVAALILTTRGARMAGG